MPRKRTPVQQVRTIVSRRTHGAAFNPPPEGYEALMKRVLDEVEANQSTMTPDEFQEKYKEYLW